MTEKARELEEAQKRHNTSINSPISSIWSKAEHMKDNVYGNLKQTRNVNIFFRN